MGAKKYFCVSTDKAANPVNMMGASKRIMEMFLMRESLTHSVSMARFANVAFSDGSLLHGFNQRFAKRQPISAPKDVQRYFITPQESGELCLLSALLGDNRDIFFPKLSKSNPNQISSSILSGITPKFISVNIFGRVESPGVVRLPLEAVLSDAIDLTGPIKPLSGKIVLVRYEKDGTVIKKNISYSARAKRGSKRNPYLKEDDLITVKNSILGKTTGVLKEVTAPFVGIYSTKELIEGFSD